MAQTAYEYKKYFVCRPAQRCDDFAQLIDIQYLRGGNKPLRIRKLFALKMFKHERKDKKMRTKKPSATDGRNDISVEYVFAFIANLLCLLYDSFLQLYSITHNWHKGTNNVK